MAVLEKHFVPKVIAVACRHTFRQHVQRADETTPQYLAALKALATSCGFGEMESEMIRDQLNSNEYLSAVKDKLLLEKNFTLDKAQVIACQVEAVVKSATLLSSVRPVPTASIQAVGAENGLFE